jgi:hypothetical protein
MRREESSVPRHEGDTPSGMRKFSGVSALERARLFEGLWRRGVETTQPSPLPVPHLEETSSSCGASDCGGIDTDVGRALVRRAGAVHHGRHRRSPF